MKGRILLVDDEDIVLRSCQRILGGTYDIDTAHNGLEALGKVNENRYDVLVLDIKMPKMDGIEVLRRVKEARPDIDVIMVTGLHEIGTAVKAMKLGALDYLSSAGLRVLLSAAKEVRRREGKIVLCALTEFVKEIFEVSGFESLIPIEDSVESGMKLLA